MSSFLSLFMYDAKVLGQESCFFTVADLSKRSVKVLQHHLRLHIPACIWFARYLASDGALLNGLLRECPHPAVR